MNDELILKGIADNQALAEALHRAFEAKFQASLKEVAGLPVDQIGMFTKSRVEGMLLVDAVFKDIARLKTAQATQLKENPAR